MRPTTTLQKLVRLPVTVKPALRSQTRFVSYVPFRRPFQPSLSRTTLAQQFRSRYSQTRYNSSASVPAVESTAESTRPPVPAYLLTFTCKPCGYRSAHQVTKQGYHHGTVLITCPSCKNRHVIADHLKVFMDKKSSLEDILQQNAGPDGDLSKLLKRGKLGIRQGAIVGNEGEGDIEFWEDGSESTHTPSKDQP